MAGRVESTEERTARLSFPYPTTFTPLVGECLISVREQSKKHRREDSRIAAQYGRGYAQYAQAEKLLPSPENLVILPSGCSAVLSQFQPHGFPREYDSN